MHPIWDIPEIVEFILDFLSTRDAAVLTAVRRAFWRTALPYIWREIDTFYKLILLLPEDALSKWYGDGIAVRRLFVGRDLGTANGPVGKPFTLKRHLQESDWERFLVYSRYTKKLSVILSDETLKDYLPIFANLPATPILPNLTSTQFEVSEISRDQSLETMSTFLPQTISEVQILVVATGAVFSTGRVLQALREEITLPDLKSFAIKGFIYPTPYLTRGITELLLSQHGIQNLDISIGSGSQILELIHSVGELPHLRQLRSRALQWEGSFDRSSRILFPSLEAFEIRGSPSFIYAVLDCIGSEHMRSVQVFVYGSSYGDDLEAYVTLMSRCLVSIGRFTHLKTLDLELTTPISGGLLDHVWTCESIEALRLVGVDLGPLETEETHPSWMTTTWPRLTKVELKSTFNSV
ncbi:hypothetical protein FS837_004399 [Tulasnella sp. UAMH 9824]|nr:hypothetical protein FS837_004399 [Tulasnella sp. UAMH 9824]